MNAIFPMNFRWPTGFAFVAALSWMLPAAGQTHPDANPEPWTLGAAIRAALAHSPDATLVRERVVAARAMVAQASAAGWPQVSLKGSYRQTDNPMMAFGSILSQHAFNFGIDFNHPGQIDNLNLTASVGYNLYSGGRATAGKAAARAGADAVALERDAALAQLSSEVTRAYFQIRQSREGVAALEAAVATYEESLRVSRLRFDAGQMLKSELLNLEVQLAQTREQLLGARHNRALAERFFLFLLGREGGEAVVLAENDATAATLTPPENLSAVNRAELQAMRRRVTAAEQMVQVARGGRRPTVNAFASYQHDQGWRLDGNGQSWMAGVQAEIAIFDGPLTSGRIHQAAAELAQAREGLRKLELALGFQFEQARLAHTLAREQLAVTATLVSQADESARISRERFTAGSLLSAELIGVETRLAEARMHRAVALANERIAAAELRRAAGQPILSD